MLLHGLNYNNTLKTQTLFLPEFFYNLLLTFLHPENTLHRGIPFWNTLGNLPGAASAANPRDSGWQQLENPDGKPGMGQMGGDDVQGRLSFQPWHTAQCSLQTERGWI